MPLAAFSSAFTLSTAISHNRQAFGKGMSQSEGDSILWYPTSTAPPRIVPPPIAAVDRTQGDGTGLPVADRR